MKKRAPALKEREKTKLKDRLALRERQLGLACAGLKAVVRFKSAHRSVFVTEVEVLQRQAMEVLRLVEAARLSQALRVPTRTGERLNRLYGKFGKRPDGSLEDD